MPCIRSFSAAAETHENRIIPLTGRSPRSLSGIFHAVQSVMSQKLKFASNSAVTASPNSLLAVGYEIQKVFKPLSVELSLE